ncbi:MAG: glucokinase [Acidobacteriota bacterium]|nr:glucokinase [Acidobacteriota bacterium]
MTFVGIDIGGTQIKIGVVSSEGELLAHQSVNTPTNLDAFRGELQSSVSEMLKDAPQPLGVGIGCKGIVNINTTEIETLPGTFRFLEGVSLADLIRPVVPVNTLICADNDARVALAGEVEWGAAMGRMNALMLTLGTGIGGALLADGKILRGARGIAGHLGHITINALGSVCSCGNHGCLETAFSALAIEAEAIAAIHLGCESMLTEQFQAKPDELSCRDVFDAAAAGDSLALTIRDRAIKALGAGLAGLVHAFDPELVILGGQITAAGATLFEPLREEVWWRSRRFMRGEIEIVPQQVKDQSGVVGAAALARSIIISRA